jgi:hypothetical protein
MDNRITELIEKAEQILQLRKREYTHDSNDPVRFNEWDVAFKELENAIKQFKTPNENEQDN